MTTSVAPPRHRAALLATAALLAGALVAGLLQGGHLALPARLWLGLQVAPVAVVGLLLARERPGSRVARLVLGCGAGLCLVTVSEALLLHQPGAPAGAVAALQVGQLAGTVLAFATAAQLLAVFPSGRADTPPARALERCTVPLLVLTAVLVLVSRGSWEVYESAVWRPLPERFPLRVAALDGLRPLALAAYNLVPTALVTWGIVVLFRRRRRVEPRLRPAVRTVVRTALLASGASVVVTVLAAVSVLSTATAAALPCMFVIPVGMAVVALRDDAFDLDLLLRRTVLFSGASALIAVAVAGLAAALGLTARGRLPLGGVVVLTVLAMLALAPVRRRLEASAGRWAFGSRVGGRDVVTQVGTALEHAYDLAELLPRLAATVRGGLGVTWAQVHVALGAGAPEVSECLGSDGERPAGQAAARSLPLLHAGEEIGRLECGERADGVLTPADDEVLGSLVRSVALAVHNARLAAELAGRLAEIGRQADELSASRARLVTAAESERRRLERDLHDGAQQEIVALLAKLRLARNRLARGDGDLDGVLEEVSGDAQGLLEELRELAHGIRPPVLADRGLVGALEARAARLPVDVEILADPAVAASRYDDDVEGAAWFAASELCTNALKHSGASRLRLSLGEEGGVLRLVVGDDGTGLPAAADGSGLRGLRDRVEALGGRLHVDSRPGGGTSVAVELPARRRGAVDA